MHEPIFNLRNRWDALFRSLAAPDVRQREFARLAERYQEPGRHYHNLDHIEQCLGAFDTLRHLAPDPDTIEMALFFHDVVFDPHCSDNETRSADYADEALARLGAPAPQREEVGRLILLTRHDHLPGDIAGRVMVDSDLASLGAPPEVFDQNGRNIRLEFAHLDDAAYRASRDQFLQRFLSRPRIFGTGEFFARYEAPARANLARVVAGAEPGAQG